MSRRLEKMKKLKRIVAFIVGWIDLEIILVAIFPVGYPKLRAWSMLLTTILWIWPLWPYVERIDAKYYAKYVLARQEKQRRSFLSSDAGILLAAALVLLALMLGYAATFKSG